MRALGCLEIVVNLVVSVCMHAALELKASYLLSFYRFTHTSNVQKAHEKGLKVLVWTINKQEEVSDYVKKGVDGIASDRPEILK